MGCEFVCRLRLEGINVGHDLKLMLEARVMDGLSGSL